jgi:YVTN family beta-propeller protein
VVRPDRPVRRLRRQAALVVALAACLFLAPTAAAREAFVANGTQAVVAFDTATNQVVGSEIPVGLGPFGIAITPDARTAYVTNIDIGLVKAIDIQAKQVVGQPIMVGGGPEGIAITPDGSRAYVANEGSKSVSVIDTATNQVVGSEITVGGNPHAVAITPDGSRAYVANEESGSVSVIDTATNQVVGSPITIGASPQAIAITPDQAPVASFTNSAAQPGVAVTLDGSASRDTDGSISRFEWDFGGEQAVSASPTAAHTFAKPGRYPVTLTVTDDEGCSTSLRFTGQTAYCNGSASARLTRALVVAYPAVRVRCPKRAGKGGCRFKITALTKRRRGKAMTRTARGRARAGKSTLVSLKPKPRFAAAFSRIGKRILIREKLGIGGSVKKHFVRLPIVG